MLSPSLRSVLKSPRILVDVLLLKLLERQMEEEDEEELGEEREGGLLLLSMDDEGDEEDDLPITVVVVVRLLLLLPQLFNFLLVRKAKRRKRGETEGPNGRMAPPYLCSIYIQRERERLQREEETRSNVDMMYARIVRRREERCPTGGRQVLGWQKTWL